MNSKCPTLLASRIARTVTNEALKWDKTAFLERIVADSEETLKDAGEDKNSSDTDILDEDEEEKEEPKPPCKCQRKGQARFQKTSI